LTKIADLSSQKYWERRQQTVENDAPLKTPNHDEPVHVKHISDRSIWLVIDVIGKYANKIKKKPII